MLKKGYNPVMRFLILPIIFIFSGCIESNHLDYGKKIDHKLAIGDCFAFSGDDNKVIEILKKNYRYRRLSDQKELVYPISSIDSQSEKVKCPQ